MSNRTLIRRLSSAEGLMWRAGLLGLCVLLTGFTVYDQVVYRVGMKYLWDEQLRFHRWVIEGLSINPWQYRILAPYLIEGLRYSVSRLIGGHISWAVVFVVLRLGQNLVVFLLAAAYWRRLGVARFHVLLGLALLAWGLPLSNYRSGLAFDTYFDIAFQLLGAWLILTDQHLMLIPLMALAATNRETSGTIGLMALAASVSRGSTWKVDRRRLAVGLACLTVYAAVYLGIRAYYGPRPWMEPGGVRVGMDLLLKNLFDFETYFFVFGTVGLAPLLALLWWRRWPPILKKFFWAMVPIWIVAHLPFGLLSEGRLFLVPNVVVFLPATLLAGQSWEGWRDTRDRSKSGNG